MPQTARRFAITIAVIAAFTLISRIYLNAIDRGSLWASVSHLTQFFTILTNLFVCIAMACIAWGRAPSPRMMGAAATAITGVGIVYHTLLAGDRDLTGIDLLLDHGLHTIVPILTSVWFILFITRPQVEMRDVPFWVIWPLIYSVYVMVRAQFSDFYPYFFLDLNKFSLGQVALNMIGLAIAFMVIGVLLIGLIALRQRVLK